MRKLSIIAALAALTLTNLAAARGQSTQNASTTTAPPAARQHLIGEVTTIDAATGRVTVKPDGGVAVDVATDEKTLFRRIPPGQTTLDKAEPITRADVRVGDRVLVPNGAGGGQTAARQVIIMARAALAEQREREREERRRRTLVGRVTAVDPSKREITVQARSREGVQDVMLTASDATRFLRYAPDSLRAENAQPGTPSDVRVGDQLRATGDRDATGTRFTAGEVITGTVARIFGQITAVDAARGEVTVRNELMEQTFTVALGKNSSLRRLPPDYAATLAERRAQREQRRGERRPGREDSPGPRARVNREGEAEGREDRGNARGEGGGRGPRGGGGNFQTFENLPAITAAELKKGDAVIVTGTSGADAARLTAVTLVTGDADVLRLMQRGTGGERNLSPGLPGDVMGGGTGGRDQP